jgi:hypothetical protein
MDEQFSAVMREVNTIDTSRPDGRQLFYKLCYMVMMRAFNKSSTVEAIQTIFGMIIETERSLFNNRRVLNFITNFLIANSDGDNLQCKINLQLLYYILNRYH